MESQPQPVTAKSKPRSQTPSLQTRYSLVASGLDTSLRVYRTQRLHGVNYNRGSTSGRRPIGGGQRHWRLKKKTTETEACSSQGTIYACTVPGSRFPVKFGWQPIKLELCPLAHTYPANYVSVHCRYLGVYKESQIAYRAIRVRVS